MNTARRDRWLVAAGVVLMLVALVVVGRMQGRNPEGDAAVSQPTLSTARIDAAPVASGLVVAGRVVLPGPAAAVAVGEDAVWVLLGHYANGTGDWRAGLSWLDAHATLVSHQTGAGDIQMYLYEAGGNHADLNPGS